mgnify:CR=1 FL=1
MEAEAPVRVAVGRRVGDAGSGTHGSTDGVGAAADFYCPRALFLDEAARSLFVVEGGAIRVITVDTSDERRAARRVPLMLVRKRIQAETTPAMPEPLPGGVQEPLVREALRFIFVRCPADPYSVILRFLVA